MIRIDKIRGETISLDNAIGTLIAYCTSVLFQPWYMQLARTLCDGFQIKYRTKAGLQTQPYFQSSQRLFVYAA